MTTQIEKYRQKKAHKDPIVSLRYSPTGRFLVSADQSGEIIVWPEGHPHGAKRVRSPYPSLTGVWFSENEEWLLVGHQWGYLLVYSLPKLKLETEIQLKPDRPKGYALSGALQPILDWVVLAVCPSNDFNLYATLEDHDFFTIRHKDFQVMNHVHLYGPQIKCSTASSNGRPIFFGNELGYIYRFRLPEMKLESFSEHHERVSAFDLTMRSTTMDASTGIAALALSRDSKLLASTSRTGGAQIWQTEARRCEGVDLREFRPFAAREPVRTVWIRGASFLPNSTALALGADDGIVEVWDYASGQISHIAKCPTIVRSLDFSPDGSQLTIGCEDGSVFLIPWGTS